MISKQKRENVVKRYRQLFLSGYEHTAQSSDEKRDSQKNAKIPEQRPEVPRGKGSYNVSVQFVIEEIGNDCGKHTYRVLLNDDPNILIAPYSIRSKKETGQTFNLPKKNIKGGTSFSVVYGVHEKGGSSLSHTEQHKIQFVTPLLYSFILGAIDRAIECTVLEPNKEQANDDTNKRIESTPPPKNVGTDKKAGRGKKIRAKVLPKALPEEAAGVVETNGSLLGGRQADAKAGPVELASGTYQGGELADSLSDGQPPDIGF